MKIKKILVPLPRYGCDPSEVAIPWQLLTQHSSANMSYQFTFATLNGELAVADEIMLTGKTLGIVAPLLKARADAVLAFHALQESTAFNQPLTYAQIKAEDFDALLLPGGHDKGVKEYLESPILQQLVVKFFAMKKPVAAICHGVLLPTRSIDPTTNKSVIYNFKTTGLLKRQELSAYHLTRWWLKDYYLTYPETTTEDEIKTALASPEQFIQGTFPLFRDNMKHLYRGFVVQDQHYLSARWPGDIYNFSLAFMKMLQSS
jgi:protease I